MSEYKKEVIDAAVQGLVSGGFTDETAQMIKPLLEIVYQSGYNEAKRDLEQVYQKIVPMKPMPWIGDVPDATVSCAVCGINSKNTMGYVCGRHDCPTRVTC